MLRQNSLVVLQFLIFSAFAGFVSISPSLKIIPNNLIITSFHDNQRLIELLLISLLLLHGVLSKQDKSNFLVNKSLQYALYTLIALAITSSYFAISPRHALIEISLFAGLSYLTMFVNYLYNENKAQLIKRLTYVFWAGVLLCMVSFYVGYITAIIFNTPVKWPNPLTGFSNIRSFNQYQLWTLGLVTLPLLTLNFISANARRWLHIGLSFWFVLLFFSASRGALLAWLIGILATAVIYRKLAWPFVRIQIIHIIVGYLIYEVLFLIIPNIRESAVVTGSVMRDSTSDRIELWELCLNLIQANPYFGIGPMNFAWVSNVSAHPHNSVLQLMSEWGLPAALIILTISAYGLTCWIRKFSVYNLRSNTELDINLIITLFFTLITSALYSLVDGVIVMPISQVMMFTVIGLMIGCYNHGQLPELKPKAKFKPIFAGVVLVTLVWSTLPEILQGVSGNDKMFSMRYKAIAPRFWLEVK